MSALLEAVRRHTETHAGGMRVATSPVAGLTTVRALSPSGIDHVIARPLICLILQGSKQVAMGARTLTVSAGDSLLISADVPIVSQITHASRSEPYLAIALELDSAVLAALATEMDPAPDSEVAPVQVQPTETEVADAALRLLRLLDRPAAAAVLRPQRVRELHYWLLAGGHGASIRRLGWTDGHAARITRAVAILRAEFANPLPVERLAASAGMSPSSFHEHFRTVTSLSPRQFQKQLRLIEARRLMVSEGASAGRAAFAVGYESVPQFTREYARMFGMPPARDADVARAKLTLAA